MSSDKNFLITLSIILIILFAIFRSYYFLYCSIGFLIVAYSKPNLLHLLNYFFLKIGFLILVIVQPIILRINFYLIFGFISLIMKLFSYDPLKVRKVNKKKTSFWLDRKVKSESIELTKEQF